MLTFLFKTLLYDKFLSSANGVFTQKELKGEIFNLVRRTFYYQSSQQQFISFVI